MINRRDAMEDFRDWQACTVHSNAFNCQPISFDESREWCFDQGKLRHRTGGWFFIAGIEGESRLPELNGQQQLIIVQRQIAINGFLVRSTRDGLQILFQGRVEPGNINGMQLAPTVQSTVSNYQRVHGGKPTSFIEYFLNPDPQRVLLDQLQSEEATRYLGKYNRNIVVTVPHDIETPENFRWYDLAALRLFSVSSNILNTDARSVLSSLDWHCLTGADRPFNKHPVGSFGSDLRTSYEAPVSNQHLSTVNIIAWLTRLRAHIGLHTQILPISSLNNWLIENNSIRERQIEHGFRVRQFRVTALGREVKSWDQPLIESGNVGRLALVFQKRDDVLQVLVKASYEIGYLEGAQLSTSICIPPGEKARCDDPVEGALIAGISEAGRATVIHRCRQSEEGGRFYQDENDYEIILLDPSFRLPESDRYRWLTLSQVSELIKIPGIFSIEFRGALALLLAYI